MSEDESAAECSLLFVKVNNTSHPEHTLLTVDTRDYPGLHRAVAWALNGLSIRAQNAEMKRAPDGFAELRFWLTDLKGKKLTERSAFDLRESLTDFIETCMPPSENKKVVHEWQSDGPPVSTYVSNLSHDQWSELVIAGEPDDGHKAGFLLELFTVLSASGATIRESTIQSNPDFVPLLDLPNVKRHNFKKGRVFRFLLSDGDNKLTPGRIQSLLFMVQLIQGKGYQPTTVDGGQSHRASDQVK